MRDRHCALRSDAGSDKPGPEAQRTRTPEPFEHQDRSPDALDHLHEWQLGIKIQGSGLRWLALPDLASPAPRVVDGLEAYKRPIRRARPSQDGSFISRRCIRASYLCLYAEERILLTFLINSHRRFLVYSHLASNLLSLQQAIII